MAEDIKSGSELSYLMMPY